MNKNNTICQCDRFELRLLPEKNISDHIDISPLCCEVELLSLSVNFCRWWISQQFFFCSLKFLHFIQWCEDQVIGDQYLVRASTAAFLGCWFTGLPSPLRARSRCFSRNTRRSTRKGEDKGRQGGKNKLETWKMKFQNNQWDHTALKGTLNANSKVPETGTGKDCKYFIKIHSWMEKTLEDNDLP